MCGGVCMDALLSLLLTSPLCTNQSDHLFFSCSVSALLHTGDRFVFHALLTVKLLWISKGTGLWGYMNNTIDWQDQYGHPESGFTVGGRRALTRLPCPVFADLNWKCCFKNTRFCIFVWNNRYKHQHCNKKRSVQYIRFRYESKG